MKQYLSVSKKIRNFQKDIIAFELYPHPIPYKLNLKKGKTRVEEFTAGQETSIAKGVFDQSAK